MCIRDRSIDEFNSVIGEINKIGICAIDTETDSLDIEKANLVGISLCYNENFAYYIPINHKDFVNKIILQEQIPEQKILDVIKFEKKSQVIITRGTNAGRIGIIDEIKEGTFTLPKRISLLIGDNTVEIPANITMVVGKEKPIIQIK